MEKTAAELDNAKNFITHYYFVYGNKVLGAVVILLAGGLAARWLGKLVQRWLDGKQLEPPVKTLIVRVLRLLIFGLTLVIALDEFGVPITTLVAGISVAGVGIGLAMQGVLGNLVAGLTIIFTKPFRVTEYIEIHGIHGTVTQIELFSTTLMHADRSRVIIPNRKIVGEILHNYGTIRQLDLTVGVSYSANVTEAIALIRDILKQNPRVLKEIVPGVGVNLLGDSSINIGVKPWVAAADYGAAQAEIYQTILDQFRTRQIEIPFPQREIRLLNGSVPPARIPAAGVH
jgi:small conductance mechanosensitive channel